jgi:hypothetical protein
VAAWDAGNHRNYLHAADEGWLAVAEGVGSVSLFLFAAAEFLPGATSFFFGDLEFAAHFLEELFCADFVFLGGLGCCEGISSALSFGFELAIQVCLHFLGSFLFGTGVEEPTLELAFRGGS